MIYGEEDLQFSNFFTEFERFGHSPSQSPEDERGDGGITQNLKEHEFIKERSKTQFVCVFFFLLKIFL